MLFTSAPLKFHRQHALTLLIDSENAVPIRTASRLRRWRLVIPLIPMTVYRLKAARVQLSSRCEDGEYRALAATFVEAAARTSIP